MTEPGERHELMIERHIAAPPEAVWHALTTRMEEYFCPRPWRVEVIEQDLRPGGRSAMIMHGPDGERHELEGLVLEAVPNRRLVTTDALTGDWQPAGPFMVGITELTPDGDGTRYIARARHWTAEAKAQHEAMGFYDGWRIVADQLAELVEKADAPAAGA